jgi:hypothetical protein
MKLFRTRLTEKSREKFWIPPVAMLPEPSAARKAAEAPMKPSRRYQLPESLSTEQAAPAPAQVVAAE